MFINYRCIGLRSSTMNAEDFRKPSLSLKLRFCYVVMHSWKFERKKSLVVVKQRRRKQFVSVNYFCVA